MKLEIFGVSQKLKQKFLINSETIIIQTFHFQYPNYSFNNYGDVIVLQKFSKTKLLLIPL